MRKAGFKPTLSFRETNPLAQNRQFNSCRAEFSMVDMDVIEDKVF